MNEIPAIFMSKNTVGATSNAQIISFCLQTYFEETTKILEIVK